MNKRIMVALAALMLITAFGEGAQGTDESPTLEANASPLLDDRAAMAKALQAGDCETVNAVLDRNAGLLLLDQVTLLMEGRCVPANPALAASMLNEMVEGSWNHASALARLGALYETGRGVDQDVERAAALYRRAVGWMGLDWAKALNEQDGPTLEEMAADDPEMHDLARTLAALNAIFPSAAEAAPLWNLSVEEAVYGFVEPASGPWTIPPLLQAEIDAIRPLVEGGGEGALEMAQRFREGRDGYPIDDVLAFQWVKFSAVDNEYVPARRAYAEWGADPAFCQIDDLRCWRRPLGYNDNMVELVRLGDLDAIDALSTCAQKASDFDHKPLQVYLWLQLRLRYGLPVDDATLQAADEAFSDEYEPVRRALADLRVSEQEFKKISREWDIKSAPILIAPFADEACLLHEEACLLHE